MVLSLLVNARLLSLLQWPVLCSTSEQQQAKHWKKLHSDSHHLLLLANFQLNLTLIQIIGLCVCVCFSRSTTIQSGFFSLCSLSSLCVSLHYYSLSVRSSSSSSSSWWLLLLLPKSEVNKIEHQTNLTG